MHKNHTATTAAGRMFVALAVMISTEVLGMTPLQDNEDSIP